MARADLEALALRSGGHRRGFDGAGAARMPGSSPGRARWARWSSNRSWPRTPASTDEGAGDAPPTAAQLDSVLLRIESGHAPPAADLVPCALRHDPHARRPHRGSSFPAAGKAEARVVAATRGMAASSASGSVVTLEAAPCDGARSSTDVGGLSEQIARVEEMISTPLLRPELYERLGISPPRGVLFCGPPGSGKTLLARAVAGRTEAAFFHIDGPEIISKHYGDSEEALRRVFDAAVKRAPSIVFIDEIDAIAPRRDALSSEKQVERRVVAQLLTLLDGLEDRGRIVVMAATNLPDGLDPALRRPGRFDREIVFRPPSAAQRREILAVHLARAPLDPDVDLDALAETTHGYVGADLAALAREAAVAALARTVAEAGGEDRVRPEDLRITRADLARGHAATGPSALRGAGRAPMQVSWNDVGGAARVRDALRQAVLWPLRHAAALGALGVRPARGVLLTGPPGCGKTLAARALAAESGMNLLHVHPPRLLSQYLGEAERAVAGLFATARATAPALVFFDEFDALAPRRSGRDATLDRIVAQLLTEFDGLDGDRDVVVLAATNRPGAIDPALLRPGRFDTVIRFTLPDAGERRDILAVHLRGRACRPGLDLDGLAEATEGFSGAELATLVDDAARGALGRILLQPGERPESLGQEDIDRALTAILAARRARGDDFLAPHAEAME
jgi:transitional endoplasmic reticulum ATPase